MIRLLTPGCFTWTMMCTEKNIIGNLHFVCVCLYLPAIKRKLMQHCITTLNVSECVFNIIHNICIIKLLSDYIIQVFVCICWVEKGSVSSLIMYSLRLYLMASLVFCTFHSDTKFSYYLNKFATNQLNKTENLIMFWISKTI